MRNVVKKHKLLMLITLMFAVWFTVFFAFGAAVTRELKFEWTQSEADMANLKEWRFYYATAPGGPYQPWLDTNGQQITVPYDPANMTGPTYVSTPRSVNVDIEPGKKVTYYFCATAVDNEGDESAFSAEALNPDGTVGVVFKSFLGVPVELRVVVTINKANP